MVVAIATMCYLSLMLPTRQGSFRLFRLAGIDVFLHWSWFLIAWLGINYRVGEYHSMVWNVLEYLTLFVIVLMHEFGHALACRQVGGQANQIILWPLGGVAYVSPPQRAGATLWSIAAGPLVNLLLLPVLTILVLVADSAGWQGATPDACSFLRAVWFINLALLIFNLVPIYPLDGGQILRSLLWFLLGRARSLTVATSVGFVGVAGLLAVALWKRAPWLGVMTVFILLNCWRGLMQARALSRIANAPGRAGFACPACKTAPPQGAFWMCGTCRKPFDMFEAGAVCPHCGTQFGAATCPECSGLSPLSDWKIPAPEPPLTHTP
jgi:Zn-dependent protease